MSLINCLESAEYNARRTGDALLAAQLRDHRLTLHYGRRPQFTAQQSRALREVGYNGCTGFNDMHDLRSATLQSLGGLSCL